MLPANWIWPDIVRRVGVLSRLTKNHSTLSFNFAKLHIYIYIYIFFFLKFFSVFFWLKTFFFTKLLALFWPKFRTNFSNDASTWPTWWTSVPASRSIGRGPWHFSGERDCIPRLSKARLLQNHRLGKKKMCNDVMNV